MKVYAGHEAQHLSDLPAFLRWIGSDPTTAMSTAMSMIDQDMLASVLMTLPGMATSRSTAMSSVASNMPATRGQVGGGGVEALRAAG